MVHYYSAMETENAKLISDQLSKVWKSVESEFEKLAEPESIKITVTNILSGCLFAALSVFLVIAYFVVSASQIKQVVASTLGIPQLANAISYLCIPVLGIYPFTISILLLTDPDLAIFSGGYTSNFCPSILLTSETTST